MKKFAFITDLHLANKPPVNRLDEYNESIFAKIHWVLKYCAKKKIRRLIIGGDLAHSYKPDDELIYRFVELMQRYDMEVYYIYGNHDTQGGNANFTVKTNFGLLSQHSWFHLLDKKPVRFGDVVLSGMNYSADTECQCDWPVPKEGGTSKDCRILVVHGMIVNEQSIIHEGRYKQVNVYDVTTNADLLLCGHYHLGFPKPVRLELLNTVHILVNPGSIARIDALQARTTSGPRLAEIEVRGKQADVALVDIPCKPVEEIFDCDALNKKKVDKNEKANFVMAMQELLGGKVMGGNFVEQLRGVLNDPPPELRKAVNPSVIKLCLRKVEEHL